MIIKLVKKYYKVIITWILALGVMVRIVNPIKFAIYCETLEYLDLNHYFKRLIDFGKSKKDKKK